MKKRLYHYPKGYIDKKTGKAKKGFMTQKAGARNFVKAFYDDIKSGNLPYDSLTRQEKQVYRGLNNRSFENIYQFGKERFYDPTGALRVALDNDPNLRGKRNLTNLLSEENFKSFFDNYQTTTQKIQDALNNSFYEFDKGSKKKFYRNKFGTLLDMVSKLKNFEKKGFEISVIDKNGKSLFGAEAINYLREKENDELRKVQEKKKPGEKLKLQIVYPEIRINPYRKTISIDSRRAEVNDFENTP